ncbi:Cytochrome P450 85A [Vitis vinifera]|uniref:Cytochrome P450 85A n=1 Tax=Vitis vinifera TaxID=29760 RepID=A0A438E3B8_VITVI|nr:Cytochrome P450 85A [Vitis vinifera]
MTDDRYGNFFKTHIFGCPTVICMDPGVNRYILLNEGKGFVPGYPPSMRNIVTTRIYLVKRRLYIYRASNFLPYPMWDITNTPHADTTSSLCPMGLRGQTDKAKQTPIPGSGIGSDTICNDPHPIM